MKKRNEILFYDICIIIPFIVLGLWMMTSPDGGGEHQEIEKATVHFVKEIWGPPTGLTLLIFGLLWLIPTIIKYKKVDKSTPNNNMTYLFYSICFFILTITGLLYVIVLVQNFFGIRGIIPVKYVYEKMGEIHMVFIMFIFLFSIITLIAKWRSRIAK